ncbi:ABC transporter substrate-binding protein [Phytoactinopolyspora halotolerans]|uniref:Extracellular solute-binding protein n=1 Tax=Phytoactinopolyspora halotolerans TaxID=1981512 RepID=A0A6L9SDQ6_9ACTN|nr:extracellular solute-binding protein [Phytoactinopolyspora halotolerans]NEE02672.1 extracellular solute-binding protein [Phytoactinopolyspora halotolerans]
MMNRRMYAGSAALAAAALIGCGVSPSDSGDIELSDEPVTITLNWWGADSRTQRTLEAIELFESEHPDITVEAQHSDWSGYWDRLATTTASGDAPDVSQFDQLYLASYANRGSLLDLDTLSEFLDTSALPDGLRGSGEVDGTLYAVPVGGTPNGVLINKSIFDEYGVEVPDLDTWTWEDFDTAAQRISEASDGEVRGVGPFGGDSFTLTVWARQHGEELFDETGDVVIDPSVVASYWQKALDWIDSGAGLSAEQLSEETGVPLEQGSMATGGIAMGFSPGAMYTVHAAAMPDSELLIADWPTDSATDEGFQYLKPTMYWAVSSGTEHPAEAGALIDFLINDERVARIFGTDRGVPGNPAAQEAIADDLSPADRTTLDFTASITERIGDAPAITPNGASDIETIQSRYFERVLFGELTPEEGAKQFLDEIQSGIDAAR